MTRKALLVVERVQTGIRMEKRILKVLKAVAEYHDFSLGDLLEGIVLHAFEGKAPFGPESLERIAQFKRIYGLNLTAAASHQLHEAEPGGATATPRTRRAAASRAATRRRTRGGA